MIVLSSREPVRFQQGERTYLFQAPTVYAQSALRRAIAAVGATWYSEAALHALLRRGVERLLAQPGDAAQRDEFLALIDGFAAGTLGADDLERLGEVERLVVQGDGIYARALSERAYFGEIAPIEAFRLFCIGWEGEGLPAFVRRADGVPADLLLGLPKGDLATAGSYALGLTMLAEADVKN